ncbi:MAG: hypothetical protein KDC07_06605 [Chitinophagaceae bacterium]|nr:hypothetical protein [Chitinophagaceae bacterium]MCB9047197.1 hypothetical protein [Chitinophagales bacterium]
MNTAIAILFPGVRTSDILNGAREHDVNILIKEQYDPQKNYARYQKNLSPVVTGDGISLMFVFSDGSSMLASERRDINQVMKKIGEVHGCVL